MNTGVLPGATLPWENPSWGSGVDLHSDLLFIVQGLAPVSTILFASSNCVSRACLNVFKICILNL